MKSKYLEFGDEILDLFDKGYNYSEISEALIEKYALEVSVDYLRKSIKAVVHYLIADKDIVAYNIKLAKQKQRYQDLNRIERKAFRENARYKSLYLGFKK